MAQAMFTKAKNDLRITAPPTHRPLNLNGLGVQLARARLTHIALALQTPNLETGFAYSGSGNVVGGHPLGASSPPH